MRALDLLAELQRTWRREERKKDKSQKRKDSNGRECYAKPAKVKLDHLMGAARENLSR